MESEKKQTGKEQTIHIYLFFIIAFLKVNLAQKDCFPGLFWQPSV